MAFNSFRSEFLMDDVIYLSYDIEKNQHISLLVYDILRGKRVQILQNDIYSIKGSYLNAFCIEELGLKSGIYALQCITEESEIKNKFFVVP